MQDITASRVVLVITVSLGRPFEIDAGASANTHAVLEVESNEQNTGVVRPYKLLCRSGSGMNALDIIRYKEVVDRV